MPLRLRLAGAPHDVRERRHQLLQPFAALGRDRERRRRPREASEERAGLFPAGGVQQVGLVHDHDGGLFQELGAEGAELAAHRVQRAGPGRRAVVPVEHVHQQRRALDVRQEAVPQPGALAGSLDESGDVGDGQPDQADVGEKLQRERQPELFPVQPSLGELRSLARGALETDVAAATLAAARDQQALTLGHEVAQHAAVGVEDLGAHRRLDLQHGAVGAAFVGAAAVATVGGAEMVLVAEVAEVVQLARGHEHHVAAGGAVAAVGPALVDVLLAAEALGAVAAAATAHADAGLVEHEGCSRPGPAAPLMLDKASICVRGGRGGNGSKSFRREKYVPKGGPDGGDGAPGGDVVLVATRQLHDLSHFRHKHHFRAADGGHGRGANKRGADGAVLEVKAPVGTEVLDADGGVLGDLVTEGQRLLVARGGEGGRGNVCFKSSTRQAPKFAERGLDGEELWLTLSLKLLADIGLVGLPNAGKSSLLAALTRAHPKIAAYPFTTIEPNLGVLYLGEGTALIADIPGLIEGASEGAELGHRFLAHIERTALLMYVLDGDDGG